jgi:catechol 2,3-dioxygenase-like lactoylglutathione lyase family enzyme
VAKCCAELLEKEVDIIEPPKDQEFGHRTVFFRDPEGNIIEIFAEL